MAQNFSEQPAEMNGPGEKPLPAAPYLGLRPYSEAEGALFYGRDDDARLLVNKILSARLTLLYGTTGVGKTSLLRARVIPELRMPDVGNALVVYVFDCWADPDVERAIKRTVEKAVAGQTGSDSPGGPDLNAPLLDWARHINDSLGKHFILILDQFEQFLLHRAGRLDPLRRELAALARAKADVSVVLALREEYLASLEVLTSEIVNIYDSTFRLEHLSEKGAREAIAQPAQKYGVAVEPALVDALIADLKATAFDRRLEDVGVAVGEANIELPILQILCEQIWQNHSGDTITLDLYERLGRRDGIIKKFIASLAEGLTPREQDDAAAALNWLAPRSGLKATCSLEQLEALTRLPAERIEKLLARFQEKSVLRGVAGGRYELYHDAFTKVLRGWIDSRLEHAREVAREAARKREQRRWIAALSMIAVVAFAGWGFWNWQGELKPEPPAACRKGEPGGALGETVKVELVIQNDPGVEARAMLEQQWCRLNVLLRQRQDQIVLPLHIVARTDLLQEPDKVSVTLDPEDEKTKVSIDIPEDAFRGKTRYYEIERLPAFLVHLSSPTGLHALPLDAFPLASSRTDAEFGLPLVAALPGWGYPLLRAAGIYPSPVAAVVVGSLMEKLRQDPSPTLTQPVVDFLLDRAAESSRETVTEAIGAAANAEPRLLDDSQDAQKALGAERIRQILAQTARGVGGSDGVGLVYAYLDLLLDAIADLDRSGGLGKSFDAAQIARKIPENHETSSLPETIAPHRGRPVSPPGKDALLTSYDLGQDDLPPPAPLLRVQLAGDIVNCIADEKNNLKKDVGDRIVQARKLLKAQSGIDLPGIRFVEGPRDMPRGAIRIQIRGQSSGPFDVGSGDCGSAIVDKAVRRFESDVSSEDIQVALKVLKPEEKSWLKDRFSLTDLKLLARAAMAPAQGGGGGDEPRDGPTLRDLPALMRALTFWNYACAKPGAPADLATDCVIRGLRQTLELPQSTAQAEGMTDPRATARVEGGLKALFGLRSGGIEAAAEEFYAAVEENPKQAKLNFLSQFKTASELMDATRDCDLKPGTIFNGETMDEEHRKKLDSDLQKDWRPFEKSASALQLCVLKDELEPGSPSRDRAAQKLDDLLRLPKEKRRDWTASELFAVGVMGLRSHQDELYRVDASFASVKTGISDALEEAFDRWDRDGDVDSAEAALREAIRLCARAKTTRWCVSTLDAAVQHFSKPTIDMLYWIAYSVVNQGLPSDEKRAEDLLERSARAPSGDPSRAAACINFLRAKANFFLLRAGARKNSQAVHTKLDHLAWDLKRFGEEAGCPAYSEVIDQQFQSDVAAGKAWENETNFQQWTQVLSEGSKWMLFVKNGQLEAAKKMLKESVNRDNGDHDLRLGMTELVAGEAPLDLQHLLGRNPPHPYATYARLLLYVGLARQGRTEEALACLREGQIEIETSVADAQLRDGSSEPWQQALLKYYLNGGKAEDFRRLQAMIGEPDQFYTMPLAGVGESRSDFISELYFYDALLQSVTGDPSTREIRERDSLAKATAGEGFLTFENVMAGYLLKSFQPDDRKN